MSEMKDALGEDSGPESEKLPSASESKEGFAKMQVSGPHTRVFIS